MLLLLLVCSIQSKKSKEKYKYCMELLEEKIPIRRTNKETKVIMKRYSDYFNNHPPRYDEKEKICLVNRKMLEKVALSILKKINLNKKITDKQMVRCMSRSVPLFAYTILTMADGEFSAEAEKIKNDYLRTRNNNNLVGPLYTLPKVNRKDKELSDFFIFLDDFEDLSKERKEEDIFLSGFSSDVYDDQFVDFL